MLDIIVACQNNISVCFLFCIFVLFAVAKQCKTDIRKWYKFLALVQYQQIIIFALLLFCCESRRKKQKSVMLLHLRLSNFKSNLYHGFWSSVTSYFMTSSENDVSNYDVIQRQHSKMVIKFEICLWSRNKNYWSKESLQFWYCLLVLRSIGIIVPRIVSFISNHVIIM